MFYIYLRILSLVKPGNSKEGKVFPANKIRSRTGDNLHYKHCKTIDIFEYIGICLETRDIVRIQIIYIA